MITKQQTSNAYFQSTQTLYYALIASQLFFMLTIIFIFMVADVEAVGKELKGVLNYTVPLLVIGGYLGSNALFKSKLEASKKKKTLIEKMTDYRSTLIVRYALLEAPSMFAIVAYFLTGEFLFLALAGVILILFLTIKPTKERAKSDLELNQKEEQLLNDPNAVIAEIKVQ